LSFDSTNFYDTENEERATIGEWYGPCLERGNAASDAQIDELVYELYGITADERNTIEQP
jgi:hypothetical protein